MNKMSLIFEGDDWSPLEQKFFNFAFDALCAKLGIDDFQKVLRIRWGTSAEVDFSSKKDDADAEASIAPDVRLKAVRKAVREQKVPPAYLMFLNKKEAKKNGRALTKVLPGYHALLLATLPSFCHEMIHLRQWLTQELTTCFVDKDSGIASKKYTPGCTVTTCFRGTYVDLDTAYSDQPWEIEAHDKMFPLATWFVDTFKNAWRSNNDNA